MTPPQRRVTLSDQVGDWFEKQREQYAQTGDLGLDEMHTIDSIGPHAVVNCLLWRDDDGILLGILNHYPNDILPYEKAGNVNIWVSPQHQGHGIGTRLAGEAMRRWNVDLDQQQYTTAGLALAASVERRSQGK